MTFDDPSKEIMLVFSQMAEHYTRIQQEFESCIKLEPIILESTSKICSKIEKASTRLNTLQSSIEESLAKIDISLSALEEEFKEFDINILEYRKNIHPLLLEQKWFFTESIDFELWHYITNNTNQQSDPKSFLNETFVNYYSSYDFENLDDLVDGWYFSPLVNKRLHILKECVSALKAHKLTGSNIKNPHYLVIPTLIAQIDGLMTDYLMEKNTKFANSKIKKSSERDKEFEDILTEYIKLRYSEDNFLLEECNTAKEILLYTLFHSAKTREELDKQEVPFNRHKIMHGEWIDYGNIETTIKLFLILDFLVTSTNDDLKSKNK